MESHKNYHLNVEELFISLTSKLITYFVDGFNSEMKSKSFAYSLSGTEHIYIYINIYVGVWALKLRRT